MDKENVAIFPLTRLKRAVEEFDCIALGVEAVDRVLASKCRAEIIVRVGVAVRAAKASK